MALNRVTHGGGVVFRLASEGPRYLLVEARGTRERWVFPKGHVEDGETAAVAALREVTEEAGVRARPIQRLRRVEQKKDGERILIAYFLMAYSGRATPLENRRIRWLTFDKRPRSSTSRKRGVSCVRRTAWSRSRRAKSRGSSVAPSRGLPSGSCWERSCCC